LKIGIEMVWVAFMSMLVGPEGLSLLKRETGQREKILNPWPD